jgi:hypothetical protein
LGVVKINEMMEELDLEIDDIRWYLCSLTADRILQYRDKPRDLVHLLWSGALEGELYNMEERFLEELQSRLDRGKRDEVQIRGILREAAAYRQKRYTVQ